MEKKIYISEEERKKCKKVADAYSELYKVAVETVSYTEEIKRRSQEIMAKSKIRAFDSLHIAAAEAAEADVLLTTDDKLEKMAMNLELGVKVMNPLKFAWEVI